MLSKTIVILKVSILGSKLLLFDIGSLRGTSNLLLTVSRRYFLCGSLMLHGVISMCI